MSSLLDDEPHNVPHPADEEDEEIEGYPQLDLLLHPLSVSSPVVQDDEGVGNGVPHEGEEEGTIPEEPVSKDGVGAPDTILSYNHACREQDNGEGGRDTPADDMEVVHGYLSLLSCTYPEVKGNSSSPEERTNKEEVDSSS